MFPKQIKVLLVLLSALLMNSAFASNTPITIGYTPWSDAEFVTKLTKRVLEEKMDKRIKLQQLNLAFVFKGVAEGDLDVMLMAWLPAVHREYMTEVRDEVVNLGIIYAPGKTGWGIPDYVPKEILNSIEDLKKPEVKEKLNGTIYCSGAGLSLSHNPAGQASRSPVFCGHGCRNSQPGGAGGLGDGVPRPAGAAAPAPRAGAHRVRGG